MKIKTKKEGKIYEALQVAVINTSVYFMVAEESGKFRMINIDDATYVTPLPTRKKKVVKKA